MRARRGRTHELRADRGVPARRPPDRRQRRLGVGLLVLAFLVGMGGLILLTGNTDDLQTEVEVASDRADVAEVQRDDLAQESRADATTTAALCATGGDVARALDASGLCGRARDRLNDPIVAAQEPALTPAQIEAIVARVQALSPAPVSVEEVVAAVLADPRLASPLTEADVRSIVAVALAEMPQPQDGRDGASFGGLVFARQGGQCVAIVTMISADGESSTQTQTVEDAVCPEEDPPPVVEPEPEPDPDPPAPDPTTQAPVPTQDAPPPTSVAPAPAQDPAPPAQDDGGGLGGLIG